MSCPPKGLLYTGRMNVPLSPDLAAKLARAAGKRGCDVEALAREALERLVDYDEWFTREVEIGLAQIERGELLTHDAVGARLAQRVTDKDTHRLCSLAGPWKRPTTSISSVDYLFEHITSRAPELIRTVYDAPTSLLTFPDRGRQGKKEGTREFVLPPLPSVIVYAVRQDVI